MSDSLRDQLLNAGFAAPKPKPRQQKKPAAKKTGNRQPDRRSAAGQPPVPNKKAQTEPLAGHTHVPAVKPKKQKAKKPPAVKARAGSWGTRSHNAGSEKTDNPQSAADNLQRQEMITQVRQLIETTEIKTFKGEEIYRFTLKNKIRELLVTSPVRKQLVSGELAITRLNGSTRLIPAAAVPDILDINPQWTVFLATDASDSGSDEDDEHPIPDDLIW